MLRALFTAAILSAPLTAQAQSDPALAFGARESVSSISLSPDGKTIAFVAPDKAKGDALYFVPVDGSKPPLRTLVATGDPEHLSGCNWVANDRVVCDVRSLRRETEGLRGMSRMVAVNSDGSLIKLVSQRESNRQLFAISHGGSVIDWLPADDGAVLVTKIYVPKVAPGAAVIGGSIDGVGVDRVDTRTLEAKRVLPPSKVGVEFITDGHGSIRIMGALTPRGDGYSQVIKYLYRTRGGTEWLTLGDYDTLTEEGFNPLAVDRDENAVYGLLKKDGRQALYKRFLNDTLAEALVYARPDVDIDGVIRLGRPGRTIGLTFATDRRQAIYFDPALAQLAASLGKALPETPLINFEGANADEQKLLIWAGSDVNPGKYYVFDRLAKKLSPLLLARPELASTVLAPVKTINVRAADGALVPAYLTLPLGSTGKGLPAIVMPHGGPSSRDEWGFDWLAQYYANRGYAVIQPNFRGSSGYGDSWFKNNGFKSWATAIGDVNDAGRWLVGEGIADPGKLAIVGWSYGGYAALQSGVVQPGLFKAIVAIAPVTDLGALKEQYRGAGFDVATRFIGSGPHIEQGSPARGAARISAPVLLFHGDLDQNVFVSASKLMADRLKASGKQVELVVYPGEYHSLVNSTVRADLLRRSDAFLRASMGIK